jgi:hypothetical protein
MGVWPYDWGYGYGGLILSLQVGSCDEGSGALADNGTLSSTAMVQVYVAGCEDALAGRPAAYTATQDFGPPPTDDQAAAG